MAQLVEPGLLSAGVQSAFAPVHRSVVRMARAAERRAWLERLLPGPLSPLRSEERMTRSIA